MKIAAKADHVRAARQTRLHACHWPGCDKQVPPAMWGCSAHWYRLPLSLRTRIWRAYRIGQEETGTPSREYVAVAREVRAWIDANA
jgi:CDP-diacylglycerol pyrophosphatase